MKSMLQLAVLALGLWGCASGADGINDQSSTDPNGGGGPGALPSTDPVAPTASYAGTFEATSTIDLTTGGILPGVLGPVISSLALIKDCPGQAIVSMIDVVAPDKIPGEYNDPQPGNCPTSPNLIRNLLASLIGNAMEELVYGGSPVLGQIATMIDGLAELFTRIDVIESLKVGQPDASMGVDVDQQVSKVEVQVFGVKQTVPLSAAALPGAHALTRGTLEALNAPLADARMSFAAAQDLTIPAGEILYTAVGPVLFAPFGATDLVGALKNLVDCQKLLSKVSRNLLVKALAQAVLGAICESAVTVAAQAVEAEIDKIVITLDQGGAVSGHLLDASVSRPQPDHVSDKLELDLSWIIGSGKVVTKLVGQRTGG